MKLTGFVADFLFWVAVVGDHCDNGNATRYSIVAELKRQTSLNEDEANEVVSEMLKLGKLVDDNGFLKCTIPC